MVRFAKINDLITNKISGEWGEEVNGEPGVNVLRTTNFTNQGSLNLQSVVKRKINHDLVIKKKLFKGDVIIEKSGGSPTQPVGRVVYFNIEDEDYLCNNFTAVLRPSKEVYPKYFFYALYFLHLTKKTLRYQNKTTGILNLKLDRYLEEEKIKVPDLAIQNEIAKILEGADIARQKRKAANALTDQFLQSTFLSMFGDPISNENGFEKASIGDLKCHVQIGPFGTQLHVEDYIENGIPLINPTHIQDKKVVESSKLTITKDKHAELSNYHLKEGDIIMARRGEMARCAIITDREENWLCGTGSLIVRPPKQLDSVFLLYVLSHNSIKRKLENDAQGVTMANLNKTIIENLEIIKPQLHLQQKFASIVADIGQLRQKQKQSEMELENLFQSLLQKYFG